MRFEKKILFAASRNLKSLKVFEKLLGNSYVSISGKVINYFQKVTFDQRFYTLVTIGDQRVLMKLSNWND
jgi:hypothetical protein